ncbi:hypothetical protein EBZ39_12725 [bacterium]|nr:hypothetical protein [bacterium]
MTTVTIRISPTIDYEYTARMPDFLPLDKLVVGTCRLTLEEAQAVLEDAEFNIDPDGPEYDRGTLSAYRALAKQVTAAIAKATRN